MVTARLLVASMAWFARSSSQAESFQLTVLKFLEYLCTFLPREARFQFQGLVVLVNNHTMPGGLVAGLLHTAGALHIWHRGDTVHPPRLDGADTIPIKWVVWIAFRASGETDAAGELCAAIAALLAQSLEAGLVLHDKFPACRLAGGIVEGEDQGKGKLV